MPEFLKFKNFRLLKKKRSLKFSNFVKIYSFSKFFRNFKNSYEFFGGGVFFS